MISHDFIGCSSPSEVAELLHNCLDSPAFFVWPRQHAFCVYKQWRLPHRTTDGNSTQQLRRRILVLLLECSHKCCAVEAKPGSAASSAARCLIQCRSHTRSQQYFSFRPRAAKMFLRYP